MGRAAPAPSAPLAWAAEQACADRRRCWSPPSSASKRRVRLAYREPARRPSGSEGRHRSTATCPALTWRGEGSGPPQGLSAIPWSVVRTSDSLRCRLHRRKLLASKALPRSSIRKPGRAQRSACARRSTHGPVPVYTAGANKPSSGGTCTRVQTRTAAQAGSGTFRRARAFFRAASTVVSIASGSAGAVPVASAALNMLLNCCVAARSGLSARCA